MSNDIEKDFNLGGSIERAISGKYELKALDIYKEAWASTKENFVSFLPAILILMLIQNIVFHIALDLQVGDLGVNLETINPQTDMETMLQLVIAYVIAFASREVICAPIYAGVFLMAMSHSAGLPTKSRDFTKGLQYTIPVIIATLMMLMLQGVTWMMIPVILPLYLSFAFSNVILLICEKRISPLQAMWLSLRAFNKKLFSLTLIYISVTLLLALAATAFFGIGLIIALPFYLHVNSIIYRNMFGIKLKIVASTNSKDDDDNNNSQVFDA